MEGDGPEHVYRFTVPGKPDRHRAEVLLDTRGTSEAVWFSLRYQRCAEDGGGEDGEDEDCFPGGRLWQRHLRPGTWTLIVQWTPWDEEWAGRQYRVSMVARDPETGMCTVPDGDDDGATLCDRDCDDDDATRRPGLAEACDGVDNDCNGGVDDPQGECDTEVPGLCAAGLPFCQGDALRCRQTVLPIDERCGDALDNDCDGEADEDACDPIPEGESCHAPLDLPLGEWVERDLEGAWNDERDDWCMEGDGPDHVLRFTLPGDPQRQNTEVWLDTRGTNESVWFALRYADCQGGRNDEGEEDCFPGGHDWHRHLRPGTWYVIAEGMPWDEWGDLDYRIRFVARNPQTGACLVADGDGDGSTLCDRDCDDDEPRVHPGLAEACDGLDNDCDGRADNPRGTCETGEQGACALGEPYCDGDALRCRQTVQPRVERCGDGVDEDCDGEVDEADGCEPMTPGETCENPVDLLDGVRVEGDLADATDDVDSGWCLEGDGPEHVLRLQVPGGQWDRREVSLDTGGTDRSVWFSLRYASCDGQQQPDEGEDEDCFPGGDDWRRDLRAGTWWVIVQQEPWWEEEGEGSRYVVTANVR